MSAAGSFVADLRVVLRGRNFRKLFATRLASQASDGAFQVGLASLFFFSPERAATAGAAAAAFAVSILPYTLVGPFAGVLLDRWRRRQVLLVANAVRAGLVLAVAALVLAGMVGPALYVLVLVCISVNRFFLAGLGSSLPHVVPRDELVMANAVSPTSGTLAAMAGGGLGYGVRLLVGAGDRADGVVLVLAAVGYLGSSLLARRMHRDLLGPDRLGPDGEGLDGEGPDGEGPAPWSGTSAALAGVARGLVAGARHVRERRRAFTALAVIGAHRFAFGIWTVATILICRNTLNAASDPDAGLRLLAVVVAGTGVGYALAAVLTPVGTRRVGLPRWMVGSLLLAAATQAVFVAAMNAPLLVAGALVAALATQGVKICVDATVQATVDDAFIGRVFALYDMVFNAAFVLAAVVAAALLPASGYVAPVYAGIAVLYAVAAVTYYRASTPLTRSIDSV